MLTIKRSILNLGFILFISIISSTQVLAGTKIVQLTADQISNILREHPPSIPISITPEVVFEINQARSNDDLKQYLKSSLLQMEQYKPMILAELKKRNLPEDLLAIPLQQSGYQLLTAERNLQQTAGMWQLPPSVAEKYGLTTDLSRDDRLNPQVDTVAATSYLNDLYQQFQDWNLVLVAYLLGSKETIDLINAVGSKDPWVLVRSSKAPAKLKKYFPNIQAIIIIINNPRVLD